MKTLKGKDLGWTEGLWYAVEQLVINYDQPDYAKFIPEASGIEEWEFRQVLKSTQYMVNELSEFLDKVFKKE